MSDGDELPFTAIGFRCLRQVGGDKSLKGGTALRTAVVLVEDFNEGKGDLAYRGVEKMAEKIGQSRRLIQRGINALEDAGHLEVHRSVGGNGRTKVYRMILWPETAQRGRRLTASRVTRFRTKNSVMGGQKKRHRGQKQRHGGRKRRHP